MKSSFVKRALTLVAGVLTGSIAYSQALSSDVTLESQNNSQAVFNTVVVAKKANKEAEELAVKSTFNVLFHDGIEGLKSGQPMLAEKRSDYDYRLFSTNRYINFLAATPVKTDEMKFKDLRKITYQVTVNLKALLKDAESNDLAISPAWTPGTLPPPPSISPVIVVIPELNGPGSFEDMRDLMANSPVMQQGIDKVGALFTDHKFKIRDFRTALENANGDDLLREGAQTDAKTMYVQNLPGDIVVKLDVTIKQKGATNGCNLSLRAVEKQTEYLLAQETFTSGFYHTADPTILIEHALEKVSDDFFTKLNDSFMDMVKRGRSMVLDFNISESVSDWDFDSESPADGSDFRDSLEEWIRENSFNGIYDMSASTDKYMKVTLNIPLWDKEKNRNYKVTNFTSALKRFLRSKLGDEYKPSVTALGQKLSIMIE